MSFYPANQNSNVFNADDFLSPDETNETANGNNIDANLDEYVRKDGTSIMTGALQVPQLFVGGANSLAYTTAQKTKLDDNTSKLVNVNKTATHTEISDLKCDTIQFPNAIQNQAFTDADKTQIYVNQGRSITNEAKLDGIINVSENVITTNKTLNIKDSPEIDVVNTFGTNTKFDGVMSFFRTGSVYRKWWIGTIGDTINPQNTFNICVNGNHPEPESVLQLDHNGKLTVNQLEINGEEQNHAFTNENHIDLSLFKYWTEKCVFNLDNTVFLYPIIFDSETSSGQITINNQSITYPDLTLQTTAFTNSLKNQIQTNTNYINTNTGKISFMMNKLDLISIETNNRFRLTSNNSGDDKIEVNAQSLYLSRGGVLYGEIGALNNDNTLYINGYNDKDIIINPAHSDLIIQSNNVRLENNFGDNKTHIHLDNIHIGGETQTKAFTDADYDKLNHQKLHHIMNIDDNMFQNALTPYTWHDTNYGYNIFSGVNNAFISGSQWQGGSKTILINYSVYMSGFPVTIIKRLESQLQIIRFSNLGSPVETSLFQGHANHGDGNSQYQNISYNDSMVFQIIDGDQIYLKTIYHIFPRNMDNADIKCRITITEM